MGPRLDVVILLNGEKVQVVPIEVSPSDRRVGLLPEGLKQRLDWKFPGWTWDSPVFTELRN